MYKVVTSGLFQYHVTRQMAIYGGHVVCHVTIFGSHVGSHLVRCATGHVVHVNHFSSTSLPFVSETVWMKT